MKIARKGREWTPNQNEKKKYSEEVLQLIAEDSLHNTVELREMTTSEILKRFTGHNLKSLKKETENNLSVERIKTMLSYSFYRQYISVVKAPFRKTYNSNILQNVSAAEEKKLWMWANAAALYAAPLPPNESKNLELAFDVVAKALGVSRKSFTTNEEVKRREFIVAYELGASKVSSTSDTVPPQSMPKDLKRGRTLQSSTFEVLNSTTLKRQKVVKSAPIKKETKKKFSKDVTASVNTVTPPPSRSAVSGEVPLSRISSAASSLSISSLGVLGKRNKAQPIQACYINSQTANLNLDLSSAPVRKEDRVDQVPPGRSLSPLNGKNSSPASVKKAEKANKSLRRASATINDTSEEPSSGGYFPNIAGIEGDEKDNFDYDDQVDSLPEMSSSFESLVSTDLDPRGKQARQMGRAETPVPFRPHSTSSMTVPFSTNPESTIPFCSNPDFGLPGIDTSTRAVLQINIPNTSISISGNSSSANTMYNDFGDALLSTWEAVPGTNGGCNIGFTETVRTLMKENASVRSLQLAQDAQYTQWNEEKNQSLRSGLALSCDTYSSSSSNAVPKPDLARQTTGTTWLAEHADDILERYDEARPMPLLPNGVKIPTTVATTSSSNISNHTYLPISLQDAKMLYIEGNTHRSSSSTRGDDDGTAIDSDEVSSGTLTVDTFVKEEQIRSASASPEMPFDNYNYTEAPQLQLPSELDSHVNAEYDHSWRTNMTPGGCTPNDHGAPSTLEWKQQTQQLLNSSVVTAVTSSKESLRTKRKRA